MYATPYAGDGFPPFPVPPQGRRPAPRPAGAVHSGAAGWATAPGFFSRQKASVGQTPPRGSPRPLFGYWFWHEAPKLFWEIALDGLWGGGLGVPPRGVPLVFALFRRGEALFCMLLCIFFSN